MACENCKYYSKKPCTTCHLENIELQEEVLTVINNIENNNISHIDELDSEVNTLVTSITSDDSEIDRFRNIILSQINVAYIEKLKK